MRAVHGVRAFLLAPYELSKASQAKTNEDQFRCSHVIFLILVCGFIYSIIPVVKANGRTARPSGPHFGPRIPSVSDADSTHRLSVLRGIIRVEGEGTCQYERRSKATVRPHHALEAHSVFGSAKRSNVQPRVRGTRFLFWMTRNWHMSVPCRPNVPEKELV